MSQRITEAMLEVRVQHMNEELGFTFIEWDTIGSFQTDYAYGGVSIVRITSSGGACTTIIPRGTKKEVFNRLNSFIDGYLLGRLTK